MKSLITLALAVTGSALAADLTTQPTLTLDGAKSVVSAALSYARANKAPGGAIAVVDPAGTVIYLERLDGTFANASAVSIGKARTSLVTTTCRSASA